MRNYQIRSMLLLVVFVATALAVSATPTIAVGQVLVSANPNPLTSNSHYVSATVFTWYSRSGGQLSGPWRPVEGRENWTGEVPFWKTQIKQMMAANIDVLQVQLMPVDMIEQRGNFFQALSDLRAAGYNVPKILPFLDTVVTSFYGWTTPSYGKWETCDLSRTGDLTNTAGKAAFVNQYVQFFQQYYSVNTDAHADSYIAQIDGRVLLDAWHYYGSSGAPQPVINVSSLSWQDVQSRLANGLSGHALFDGLADTSSKKIFMINSATGETNTFVDERQAQFEYNQYYITTTSNGHMAAQVKAGYWDQNVRNPGSVLKRDGGSHYTDAWASIQETKRTHGLKHVNVESWNEYDEGSGIYAANPGAPYIKPGSGNTTTDKWSNTDDPYEYIKTTAAGARQFNDVPDLGATILWNNFPSTMLPGETRTVQAIVRNEGDVSWTGAAGFKFGQDDRQDSVGFAWRTLIDDSGNEIPTYGGIFRGRPITFDVQLTAPAVPGTYTTHWSMVQEGVAWFGQELTLQIMVTVPEPSVVTLVSTGVIAAVVFLARRAGPRSLHSRCDGKARPCYRPASSYNRCE